VNPGTGGSSQRRASRATERLHLACGRKRVERPLHGALARSSASAGPSSTTIHVGEEWRAPPMLPLRRAAPARRPRCAARAPGAQTLACRAHVGQRPKHRTKPSGFDSQPRAMRFIGALRIRRRAATSVSLDTVSGHSSPQRACEREQQPDAWRARLPCLRHATT